MTSLRDAIFAADDRAAQVVDVPEWGAVKLYLRRMSVAQRDAFMEGMLDKNGKPRDLKPGDMGISLLVHCVCDETGAPVFKPEDIGKLQNKSASVMDRLSRKAMELNGISAEAEKKIEKN